MNVNFPNREAVIVRDHELRVVRRLPGNGEVKVRAGERVGAGYVLAKTDPKATAVKIPVADQLGVSPQDIAKCLMRPVGSTFAAGEALARTRRGLRNVVVASPIAGTLLSVDTDTGIAHIAAGGAGEITAMVPGDVEYVDGKQSVSIRTVGSRLFGIIGLGDAASGPIHVAVANPGEELGVSKITPALAGKIVVGGSWASAAAIKKLVEVGAVGLVTGGIVDRELAAAVGGHAEDRLSSWRLAPGDHVLGENLTPGIAMMATEGFGPLPMHPDAFAMMLEFNGLPAVLMTATRVTGFLARPQLIVPNEELLDDDAASGSASLVPGAKVRLVDQGGLGQVTQIVAGPKRSRRGDGNFVDVVDVAAPSGQTKSVPLVNIEIVA